MGRLLKGFFKFGNPFIELSVEGRKIEALLDTGFNGHVMLPRAVIEELGLEQIGISDYLTASGDAKLTKVHVGKIMLLDEEIEVPILSTAANFSLVGMGLFHDCRIVIDGSSNVVEVIRV